MATLFVPIGIPASGKSTIAEHGKEVMGEEMEIVSSDSIRKELSGDEDNQEINREVFQVMRERTKNLLDSGYSVFYDATNLSRKRRVALINENKDHDAVAIYMNTPYKMCFHRNFARERSVPIHVMERMHKTLQFPVYNEGFEEIKLIHAMDKGELVQHRNYFMEVVKNKSDYDTLFNYLKNLPYFSDIYELPQDNSNHSFSVSRHTYYVYDHVYKECFHEDRDLMLVTALLHDIGKYVSKSFTNMKGEETRYANFIGHESVGSQITVDLLNMLGFEDEFIIKVAQLVQYHMRLMNAQSNKSKSKLKGLMGDDMYKKLQIIHDADTQAK